MKQAAQSQEKTSLTAAIVVVARTFPVVLVALWTLDVALNLALIERAVVGGLFVANPIDFVSLLLCELQIAVPVTLAAGLVFGAVAVVGNQRWFRIRPVPEMLAGTSAMLVGLMLLAGSRLAWRLGPTQRLEVACATLVPTLVVWLALRARAYRTAAPGSTTGVSFAWALIPAWTIGFLNLGIARAVGGELVPALVFGACCALGAALAFTALTGGRRDIIWLLPLIALMAAGYHVAVFQRYGTPTQQTAGTAETRAVISGPAGRDIVWIVLDTVRADHLPMYGYHRNTMPALEKWSRTAVVFERAVSPAGWTAPAHASMFSGKPVSQHGIHHGSFKGGGGDVYQTPAVQGLKWLPQELQARGYECIAVSANPVAVPNDIKGFDRVLKPWRVGWNDSSLAALVDNRLPFSRALSEALRWRMPYVPARDIVSIATRAATGDGDNPVFLFVNLLDAHSPYNPPQGALAALGLSPERIFARYLPHNALTLRWNMLPPGSADTLLDLYDGELRGIDMQLERLFAWIEARFGDDVLVIVTADHGEELGEDARVGHEFGLSQSLIHVPLIIKSSTLEAASVQTPVTLRRLYDLVSHVAKGNDPDLEVLVRPDPLGLVSERYPFEEQRRTFGEAYNRAWVAMFDGDHKAVGPSSEGFELLDVGTQTFSSEQPVDDEAIEAILRAKIDAYWLTNRDRRGAGEEPDNDVDLRQMLKELGYVNE